MPAVPNLLEKLEKVATSRHTAPIIFGRFLGSLIGCRGSSSSISRSYIYMYVLYICINK